MPTLLVTKSALGKPAPQIPAKGDSDPPLIAALEQEIAVGTDDPEAALTRTDDQGDCQEAVRVSSESKSSEAARDSIQSKESSRFSAFSSRRTSTGSATSDGPAGPSVRKSSISFDTASLPEMESSVSDICLIVVGASKQALELAHGRLKAQGRLALLWTDVPPSGTFEGSAFSWLPPKGDNQSGLQRLSRLISCKPTETGLREAQWQLGGFKGRSFCKAGPDVVALGPGERYEIAKTTDSDKLGGIRVMKGDQTIWALTGAVVLALAEAPPPSLKQICMAMSVDNKCAQPLPLPTPDRFFICMVVQFVVLSLQTFAPTLQSPFKEVPTFWSALWYAVGALIFAYSVIDKWVGPSLCGVPCSSKGLKIASCTLQCVVAIVLYCVPIYEKQMIDEDSIVHYPVEFLISCVNTSVLIIACSLLHCAIVREPPRYWKWWAFQCFGPIWMGFAGFYAICVIYTYIGMGLKAPIAAAIFLPISLSTLEGFSVFMTAICYRHFSYGINALGNQTLGISMAIGMFHGMAEGARLSATLLGAVKTGSYTWVLSACLGFSLNVFSRFGWSRFYLMRLLNAISPKLRNLILPSMCSRVHDETKFLMGYVRFLTPVVMAIVRYSQGMDPFSGMSGLLVVIVAFVVEIVEDSIVRHELFPYAKPMKAFPDLAGIYQSYGRFDSLQIFVMSETHARQTRPMMLYGMRPLSLALTMVLVIPPCIFPLYLFHAYLGRGYMSGLCEDPVGNPLTLGLILQQWPPAC